MDVVIGQIVNFTFETRSHTGAPQNHYATGKVVRVGKRLSIKITDGHDQHKFWLDEYVGKVKVVHPNRIIDPLKD